MRHRSIGLVFTGLFLLHFSSYAQNQERTVTLIGNHHPLARAEFDIGPTAPDFPMQRMILVLAPTTKQQSALDALVEAQHDPASPQYHRWLTPDDFAERFGVSRENLQRVTEWLSGAGFTIEQIPAGNRSIIFSGTAAQVEAAFHTAIHTYRVNGAIHHANSTDPQIPESLAGLVSGAVSLHDFRRASMHHRVQAAPQPTPQFTSGGSYYLAPGDFATIYDAAAAYNAGINGSGQTIAIVGRINIQISDIQTFRSTFQLPVNNPTVVLNGPDPGIYSEDEEAEADLDVEWSGAVAPMATVKFVVSESTNTTDGVDLSAQYIVANNLAPVLSVSFGSCEAAMGSAEMSFYSNLWQQAASQGITALIAAGDSGAAGCDSPEESTAIAGQAINGLCSSIYSVCVGGTEFNENGNYSLYWSANNNASYASALSYIPEVAWNESGSNGGSDLWAGGGGASIYYSKPSWQSGPGVPADSRRDVPDIALAAATHDGYLVEILGGFYIIGGTSCASPSFAGVMALVNQKTGERQGNINTTLYPLAALEDSGGAQVFHAITGGNNSVPGVTGFTATAHYNQATGLGSPDIFTLVNHWSDASVPSTPSFTVSAGATASATQGNHGTVTVTVAGANGFDAAVALSLSGLPTGVTAAFAPTSIAAPGSGSSTLTLTASATATPGVYPLTITGTSGSQQKTAALSLTVVQAFTISAPSTASSIARGASGTVNITTVANSGFSGALTLSASKLPTGVTASFSPTSIAAPGSGSSTLTLSVASSATSGAYSITVSATNGSMVESATVSLTIPAPVFTISAPAAATIALGTSGSVTVTTAAQSGFSGAVAFSAAKLPTGVTAAFSPTSIAAPGSGTSKLTLTVASNAAPGAYSLTITGTSGSTVESATLALTIPAPAFAVSASATAETIDLGASASVTITTAVQSGFNGAIALSASGLPSGVTAAFSPVSIAAPGNGSSKLTITVGSKATPGGYSIIISGTNGSAVQTTSVALTIPAPTFSVMASATSISVALGSSGPITVTTAAQNGFDAAISLSTSKLPAGVTGAFSPTSIAAPGNGSSKLTLTIASNATPGTYSITISGASGSLTESASVSLIIPAPSTSPGVTIATTPSSLSITPGGTGSVVIVLTPVNGFSGTVDLSYGAMPSGVTPRWSIASGEVSLVFQVASSAPAGTYPVSITGTSTSMKSPATTTVSLTVK